MKLKNRNLIKEGNRVGNNEFVPDFIDQFLEDVAQYSGFFSYPDIVAFENNVFTPNDKNVEVLKKLYNQFNDIVDYDNEEEINQIYQDVTDLVIGVVDYKSEDESDDDWYSGEDYSDEVEEEFDEPFRSEVKTIREDFEFYKTPSGKIGVDKVITTTSKSGKTFRDGTDNKENASKAIKRIPFSQLSDDEKELAKAAYKTLKKSGSIEDVNKKFKTAPRPDVVMKADGTHADIYYDDNTDGEPDEKDVRLVASRKRAAYQKFHRLKENELVDVDLEKTATNIDEACNLARGFLPEKNFICRQLDSLLNDWLIKGWYDDSGNVIASSRTLETIKNLKKALTDKESRDYFNYGDTYDQIYDLLF